MTATVDPTVLGAVPERLAQRRSDAARDLAHPLPEDRVPPSPVLVASCLAAGARELLDARADLRSRRDAVARAAERATRLTRRAGAVPVALPGPDAAAGSDCGDDIEANPEAGAEAEAQLLALVPELERSETRVKELSAAVSASQAPSGRVHRRRIAEAALLRSELESEKRAAGILAARVVALAARADAAFTVERAASSAAVAELGASVPVVLGPLDPAGWTSWSPSSDAPASWLGELRVGRWNDAGAGTDEVLELPCVVPFLGSGRSLEIVSHDAEQRAVAVGLVRAIVLRLAALGRSRVRLTLLGPDASGPMATAAALGASVPSASNVVSAVTDALVAAERLVRARHEEGVGAPRLAERFHVVVAVDHPDGYERDAAVAIDRLARLGPEAGVYVVVHRHDTGAAGGGAGSDDPETITVLDLADLGVRCGVHEGRMVLDGAPHHALQDLVAHRLRTAPPRDPPFPWDVLQPRADRWWTERGDDRVLAPLGRTDAGAEIGLWFGTDPERLWPSGHAVITAMPGAGRSAMLRALVISLAARYRPDDLRLSLVDGRHGAEFEAFAELPHVSLVSSRTTPALLRGLLAELADEVRQRRELFARNGVHDLASYRRRGQGFRRRKVDGPVARHVVVIDEVEQAFVGDDGDASAHLLAVVEHGGAVGVHVVLVARHLRFDGLLRRGDVLARIAQRWSLAMDADDLASADEIGPTGRALVASWCDRPGRVVVNERAGSDDASSVGRLAWLHPGRVTDVVSAVATRARTEAGLRLPGHAVVVNGLAAPELLDNPHVGELLRNDCWAAPDFLEELARAPLSAGGLGRPSWIQADRPLPLLLGQELGGRRAALAVLCRRPGENLLVVGRQEGARVAMVLGALAGVALTAPPGGWSVSVGDLGAGGPPASEAVPRALAALDDLGVDVRVGRDETSVLALVADAFAEVTARRALGADDLEGRSSMLVVLLEPDRVRALARDVDGDGLVDSPAGAQLRHLLVHGPSVGVHVLLAAESVAMLRTVLADAVVQRDIHHRVVMRASEDDGFALVRSGTSAGLDADGPPDALLFEADRFELVRFRPYLVDEPDPLAGPSRHGAFADQFVRLCDRLGDRLADRSGDLSGGAGT